MSVSGTVHINLKLSGFSWKLGINIFTLACFVLLLSLRGNPDLPKSPAYKISLGLPTPSMPSLLRHHIAVYTSAEILICFPSTTHFCLALGADSPCADVRGAGNLGLSARGFFIPFIVTHVSIRTSDISNILLRTSSSTYRTLPYHSCSIAQIRSFGG